MQIENLDFFQQILSENAILYYRFLLTKKENQLQQKLNHCLKEELQELLKELSKMNFYDRKISIQNFIIYYKTCFLLMKTDSNFKEKIQWSSNQIKLEKECLLQLKKELLSINKDTETIQLPYILLLTGTLNHLRTRRIKLLNLYQCAYNNTRRGLPIQIYYPHTEEEITKDLEQLKKYILKK